MSVSLSHCLKRFPLRSFPRFYASAAVALSQKTVAAEPESFEDVKIKKRTSRAKKPKVEVEVEPKPPPPPNILEWTSVQEHLEQISETNGQLVLADIERCQPPSHARPGTPTYEAQYNELRDKLTKSFNLKQLRKFLKLYEIAPLKKTKDECAVVIMEDQWNWPSLSAIRERERESEIDVETFPLTPSQAFIILGKDGEDSRALATKYHIRMTYLANPLSLRVEGMVGSLKKFSQHIVDLKEAISEDVFELPIDKPIRTELLQRVSRLSGALTENFGPRQIRVTFNRDNPRSALVAKRLAARAVCEGNGAKQPRLFFHLPPSVPSSSPVPTSTTYPHAYSLYPFLSPRALPWTVSASGVFRLRRVEEWLSTGASENLKKTGGLLMGRGRTVTLHQDDVDLRSLLLAGFSESPPSTSRIVVASLGHVLLTSPPSEQISLTPPLQGDWKLPHILNWMQERSEPTVFIPSLPVAVLNSEPARHRMLHRLIYHAVNTEGDANGGQKFIKVELELARAIKVTEPSNERPEAAFHATCFAGQDTELDIMMPDRPTDIRFSVSDSISLPVDERPSILDEYISNLWAFLSYQDRNALQPETPLIVEHEGISYVLHSSSTVRQNVEQAEEGDSSSVQVITESALDLEGDQKSASCQVICKDPISEDGWKSFMHHCDTMSTIAPLTPKPARKHFDSLH